MPKPHKRPSCWRQRVVQPQVVVKLVQNAPKPRTAKSLISFQCSLVINITVRWKKAARGQRRIKIQKGKRKGNAMATPFPPVRHKTTSSPAEAQNYLPVQFHSSLFLPTATAKKITPPHLITYRIDREGGEATGKENTIHSGGRTRIPVWEETGQLGCPPPPSFSFLWRFPCPTSASSLALTY